MGVDKSYGSGKPRSAANSSMRRRVAAGQTPKSVKGIGAKIKVANAKRAASPLGQLGDTLFGFALPIGKVKAASMSLRAAGQAGKAATLSNRLVAKSLGKDAGRLIAQNRGATNSFIRENVIGNAKKVRNLSAESVFPRIGGAGTAVRRGFGTVNQNGLEKMIAGGREPSREMLRIPKILKGTNEAYESIAQKAIKAAKKPMTAGEKYRAGLAGKSNRVTELEKRLGFPKRGAK